MYIFGWFSTGRDEAARALLSEVWRRIKDGTIPGRIGFVFCNREPGEDRESDRFIELVGELKIPLFCRSSRRFDPALWARDRALWRMAFDREVAGILSHEKVQTVVLAGYMLVVSSEMCRRLTLINLHPAEPGGPKGTWQEVIWELIARGAETTGVVIHLVTEALDEGPPLAYCRFPLSGEPFDRLWVEMGAKLGFMSFGEIVHEEGEGNPLFREIRSQGAKREIPLLVMTLQALAAGRVRIEGGRILDRDGGETGSLCLTREVEDYLNRPGPPG